MNGILKIGRFLTLILFLTWSACTSSARVLRSPTSTLSVAHTAATYYVRPDGGSTTECTGLVDAAYPGSGTNQPCAWDHPFRALPPGGEPRISRGDTLVIGAGSYRMGYGAPGADSCASDYPWDCYMPPVPSGPNPAHPTRILGAGWNSGCPDPPELWGTERTAMILNLTDVGSVEIACLEITDHVTCADGHPDAGLACPRASFPYGDWAADGLYAEDSAHVTLRNLNIHGLAEAGVRAARLTDWTVEDVRIAGNGMIGWEGDIDGDDANAGTITFRRWSVEWNGCVETYPGGEPTGCWDENAGGYGDGVGTGATGGDWVIEDSVFHHNTSDGLDLLYHRLGGTIILRRVHAEGNAGDQIKLNGPIHAENVIAVGNCGFFERQPFTHYVGNCRAGGSAIALTFQPGDQSTIVNATVTGQGDCLLIAECDAGETCDGTESVRLRNDIFVGNPELGSGDDTTCLAWTNMGDGLFVIDHAVITGTKGTPDPCPTDSFCDVSPGLTNPLIDSFDARLLAGSIAINAGTVVSAPTDDFSEHPRDAAPDIGAYEFVQPSALAITPTHRAILPGGVAAYTVGVGSVMSPTTPVHLSASSPSPSMTLHLAPTTVTPPDQATLTVTDTHTGSTILPGQWYTIPVTATGGLTETTHATLLVGGARIYLPLIMRGWPTTATSSPPQVAGCDVFPADNIWNTPVDTLPVHANSSFYVDVIGADDYVHADFGSGVWPPGSNAPIGIPYVAVPGTQAPVSVTFYYGEESDPGPYPIPPDAPIEGGPDSDGDRHVLVLDHDACVLYELFDAWPQSDVRWEAGSGAIFDLESHALRPAGWTSADAAGLPILPGLIRYEEVAGGEIGHAIRFTSDSTSEAYVWPARHYAPYNEQPNAPPMGLRFRLKDDFDVSGFSPEVQVILQGLKKYGMILADNGSPWFISGVPDERWDNDALHELHQVKGSDFEAVDVSELMVDPDSGQVRNPLQ